MKVLCASVDAALDTKEVASATITGYASTLELRHAYNFRMELIVSAGKNARTIQFAQQGHVTTPQDSTSSTLVCLCSYSSFL